MGKLFKISCGKSENITPKSEYTILRFRHNRTVLTLRYVVTLYQWFLMKSRSLCCLPFVKKLKHDFHFFLFRPMYNKTIIRFDFCDIQNNQGLGKSYQPPQASAKYQYLDQSLIILDITNTSSNNCLWPYLKKVGPWPNVDLEKSWDSWGPTYVQIWSQTKWAQVISIQCAQDLAKRSHK